MALVQFFWRKKLLPCSFISVESLNATFSLSSLVLVLADDGGSCDMVVASKVMVGGLLWYTRDGFVRRKGQG